MVSSAKQEFFVLIGVVGVVILLVGTIMYFVEYQIPDVSIIYFILIVQMLSYSFKGTCVLKIFREKKF